MAPRPNMVAFLHSWFHTQVGASPIVGYLQIIRSLVGDGVSSPLASAFVPKVIQRFFLGAPLSLWRKVFCYTALCC